MPTLGNSPLALGVVSRWSGYGPFWAIALILWCGNSVVLLGVTPGLSFFIPAVMANFTAALGVLGGVWLWQRTYEWLSAHSMVKIWMVGCAGLILGLIKGFVTHLVFWSVTQTPFTIWSVLTQSIAPAIIGLWLVPTFGVIGFVRERYNHERDALISERLAHNLHSTPMLRDKRLSALISKVNQEIHKASSPEELHSTLQALAKLDVRHTSHVLWEKEEKDVKNFTIRQLSWNTMRNHYFPSAFLSLTLFFSLVSFHLLHVNLSEALLRSVFQALVTFLVFLVGKHIPVRGNISGPLIFFITPLCAVVAINIGTLTFFGSLPDAPLVVTGFILYVSLLSAALVLGVILSARNTHIAIRDELDRLNSKDISAEASRALEQIRRRETAELLHGYVYNQLMISSLRVHENPQQTQEITQEIIVLLESLEAGTLTYPSGPTNLSDLGAHLTELWRGVISVEIHCSISSVTSQQETNLIDRIVNELIANAHRHGKASTISISLRATEQTIQFEAIDNGLGPQLGQRGLGSAILSAATAGEWSLNTHVTGTIVSGKIPRTPHTVRS